MTTIADIYREAERLINLLVRKEMVAQGHHLTGAMEDSLSSVIGKNGRIDNMDGFAVYYTQYVDKGFPAASASFKQAPFLIDYFKARGLDDKEAKGAAFATIRTWMRTGMPTPGSHAFSSTGSRTDMIENAFVGASTEIDEFIGNGIDFVVEEDFQTEKSETI